MGGGRTIPFSSERKWSAVRLDDTLAYVLGAPDLLLRFLPEEKARPAENRVKALSSAGKRVVLLARHAGPMEGDTLSGTLEPLALIPLGQSAAVLLPRPLPTLPNRGYR